MKNYYFTYGSEGHPFKGGWTVIRAESLDIAIKAFKLFHPNKEGYNCLNCADYYTEEEFEKTSMRETGNHGDYTHECIDIYHSIIDTEESNND